jgi:hypothetical protein
MDSIVIVHWKPSWLCHCREPGEVSWENLEGDCLLAWLVVGPELT